MGSQLNAMSGRHAESWLKGKVTISDSVAGYGLLEPMKGLPAESWYRPGSSFTAHPVHVRPREVHLRRRVT